MSDTIGSVPERVALTAGDLYDPQRVRGLFDRMSRSYERMNVVMSFGFSVRWRRQMMGLVPQGSERRVLDALCGMGETWAELLRRFPDATFTAIDFSPGMVAHAEKRNRDRFGGRFSIRCEDILETVLPDASFDVIFSAYGLKTFDEAQSERFAAELARLLRPGGRYAFIEVTEPPQRILAWLYDFYLSRIVPAIGVLLVTDPVEYRMLFRYLRGYGRGERSERALRAQSALTVERRSHFFGCATSFSGERRG